MAKSAKGPAFERWFCEQLSIWFSKGENSDLFWRTAGSGARATTRTKKGKKTRGHYGDITATCSEGEAFTRSVLLELKRGYNKVSLQDLLDTKKKAKIPVLDEWIGKTIESARDAGIPYWMLVFRRDRKEPIIIMPCEMAHKVLKRVTSVIFHPFGTLCVYLRSTKERVNFYTGTLDSFFLCADPEAFS